MHNKNKESIGLFYSIQFICWKTKIDLCLSVEDITLRAILMRLA